MNPDQLLPFLQHIYVWLPFNSPIRHEVQNVINQLKAQKAQQQ